MGRFQGARAEAVAGARQRYTSIVLAASCGTADPALDVRDARCAHQKRRRGERLHGGSSRRKRRTASGSGFYLFDGIDHPLRIKVPATSTVAYYELDLAGNVRRLRNSGGSDLGGYRYTAFGQTKDDTSTLVQPLRWKARWHSTVSGAEIYDVRARQWAPEVGAFISVDEYEYHRETSTLWAWPSQNPIRYRDPSGRYAQGGVAVGVGVAVGFLEAAVMAWALKEAAQFAKEAFCSRQADLARGKCLFGDPDACPPIPPKPPEVCAEVWGRVYAACMGVPYSPGAPQ